MLTIKTIVESVLSPQDIPKNIFLNVLENFPNIKRKKQEEFKIFFEENEDIITLELCKSECFISRVVFLYETILREYSNIKRQHIYNIFLGFATSEDIEKFELEKMCHILGLMSIEDLDILRDIKKDIFMYYEEQNSNPQKSSCLFSLQSVGIFKTPTVYDGNRFILTSFGQEFKKYAFL